MPFNYTPFVTAIRSTPAVLAYWIADDHEAVAAAYAGGSGIRVPVSGGDVFLTEESLIKRFGWSPYVTFAGSLASAAGGNAACEIVQRAIRGPGLNLSDPSGADALASLVAAGVITASQATNVANLATRELSDGEDQFGEVITATHSKIAKMKATPTVSANLIREVTVPHTTPNATAIVAAGQTQAGFVDPFGQTLTYSIVDAQPNAFAINAASGEITITNNTLLEPFRNITKNGEMAGVRVGASNEDGFTADYTLKVRVP